MRKKKNQWIYYLLWGLFMIAFFVWHPFFRFKGAKEHP